MSTQSKLPVPAIPEAWNSKEAWRVFGIMSEFVSATERLNQIHPAVSIFGSARTRPDQPYFKLTEEIARRVESELQYPGQIKVVAIREMRSSNIAR